MTAAVQLPETPEPGLYPGVPEHQYRAWPHVNQSLLWHFRRSAAHARHEFLNPGGSASADLGSAIHAVLLEPTELEARFSVRPPGIDGRTKEGRAALTAWREESKGKVQLEKRESWDVLEGVRDSVLEHTLALELLTAPGLTEVSAVWDDSETGLRCKGRVDRLVEYAGWPVLVDAKSTKDASPRAFGRSVADWGYHMQAAFYLDGLQTLAPVDRRFFLVAVEKTPPFAIAVYELDQVWLDLGREHYRRFLAAWRDCQESGHWPGYPEGVETIEAPIWAARELEALDG